MVSFTFQIFNPWAWFLLSFRVTAFHKMIDIVRVTIPRRNWTYTADLRICNVWIVRPVG